MSEQEPQRPGAPAPPWWTDPTENVKQLVEADRRRQDDLRVMQAGYTAQIGEMREQHARYVAEMSSRHARELRKIETARLDAIRLVDVGAVQRAAEVQATQASALAAQVVATADAFRVSLAAALEPIQKDIRDLRDAQSRGVGGKEQVTESRDTRGEQRLNVSQVIAALAVLVAVITAVLYATKK